MLNIYHVKGTRSVRVIWLCEELGLPYEVTAINFSPEFRNSAEWRRLSPTGKVPVMTDGDLTMYESGAMVQYVLDRYGQGRLMPEPGSADSALYHQWCWFAEATFARPLGEIVNHNRIAAEADRVQFVLDDCRARARTCLDAVEAAVSDGEYLVAGEFSAADIMMGYSLMLAKNLGVLTADHPNAAAYYERLASRPAFQAATAG